MKYFFEAILLAYFSVVLANSSVQPTKTTETKKALCNVNNYNSFHAGPNCKNIKQQGHPTVLFGKYLFGET